MKWHVARKPGHRWNACRSREKRTVVGLNENRPFHSQSFSVSFSICLSYSHLLETFVTRKLSHLSAKCVVCTTTNPKEKPKRKRLFNKNLRRKSRSFWQRRCESEAKRRNRRNRRDRRVMANDHNKNNETSAIHPSIHGFIHCVDRYISVPYCLKSRSLSVCVASSSTLNRRPFCNRRLWTNCYVLLK